MSKLDDYLISQADGFFGEIQTSRGYTLPAILTVTTILFAFVIAFSTFKLVRSASFSGSAPIALVLAGFLTWAGLVLYLMWRNRLQLLLSDMRAEWSPAMATRYALCACESRLSRGKRMCRLAILSFLPLDVIVMILKLDPNPTDLIATLLLSTCLYADCTWPRDPGRSEREAKLSPAT